MYVKIRRHQLTRACTRTQDRGATPDELGRVADTTSHGSSAGRHSTQTTIGSQHFVMCLYGLVSFDPPGQVAPGALHGGIVCGVFTMCNVQCAMCVFPVLCTVRERDSVFSIFLESFAKLKRLAAFESFNVRFFLIFFYC